MARKFLIILVLILAALAGCSKEKAVSTSDKTNTKAEVKTIKIAYIPITHALPLYIENELAGENQGNFKLELVKFGSWPELVEALNAGKVDGASMLIELAVKAREQGIDLKAVALGHRDGNVVVVSNDINRTEDLKGKSFAIPSRLSTQNILLHIMLKNSGLSYSDVNIVELPPPEMPAALSEGRIAGYCVAEPFGAQAVAAGKGKILFESHELWEGSLCCGLVLRNDFIENNTEAAQDFIKEYVNAGNKAEHKDDEVKSITSKFLKAEDNVLDLSLEWISYKNLRMEEKEYNELVQYMVEMELSSNPPQYDEFVDNSLIDRVKE